MPRLGSVQRVTDVSSTLSLESVHRTDSTFGLRCRLILGAVAFESHRLRFID